MRALRVVGLGEDGKIVICETDRGERFQIPADERLRAAARGDITRLGQIAIELESQMRPREIQTRIRAGESVEQVAAAAGVPPERVERFAYPVLLERSRTAELAQKAHPVREDGPDVQELGEVVGQAFSARGQDYSAAVWDSWKGEDGKWVVQLTWTAGRSNNHAHWSFHPGAHGGTVTPLDDHALDLLDPNPNRQLRTVRPVTELAAQALAVAEPVARRQAVNGGEPPRRVDDRRVEEQDFVQDFELTDEPAPGAGQPEPPVDEPEYRPAATTTDHRPQAPAEQPPAQEYRRPAEPAPEYRRPAEPEYRRPAEPAPEQTTPEHVRPASPAAAATATPVAPAPPRPTTPAPPTRTASPAAARPTMPAIEEESQAARPAARPPMPTIEEAPAAATPPPAPEPEETPAPAAKTEPAPPAAPARKGKGRKARPSVPSWEDVLLGTRSNR